MGWGMAERSLKNPFIFKEKEARIEVELGSEVKRV